MIFFWWSKLPLSLLGSIPKHPNHPTNPRLLHYVGAPVHRKDLDILSISHDSHRECPFCHGVTLSFPSHGFCHGFPGWPWLSIETWGCWLEWNFWIDKPSIFTIDVIETYWNREMVTTGDVDFKNPPDVSQGFPPFPELQTLESKVSPAATPKMSTCPMDG